MKIIPTNRMITEIVNKYGTDSKEALLIRLYIISYKVKHTRSYEDCYNLYKKYIKKG